MKTRSSGTLACSFLTIILRNPRQVFFVQKPDKSLVSLPVVPIRHLVPVLGAIQALFLKNLKS
jgi:hypothetical protein